MIPQADRRIKKHAVPELEADIAEYQRILDDMLQNGEDLIPDPNWLMTDDTSRDAESYDKQSAIEFAVSAESLAKISKMKTLMPAWVGGSEPLTRATILKYYRLLQHCDALNLWKSNMEATSGAMQFFRQDLGSLMDLNLLYAFCSSSQREPTRLLEVGGGYGRLAEAAFNVFGNTIQYVIIDSVPSSLYYARKYLSYACPDARIGSFYDGEGHLDLSLYDIAIVPAWHFERVNAQRYDVCVNIESMQEMNQHHVDYYLNLFENVALDGATIYLSNAHDYYFRGTFNYPVNWQKMICSNTPRSWRTDHPTEIFWKSHQDHSRVNDLLDALNKYRVSLESDPQECVARHGVMSLASTMLRAIMSNPRLYGERVLRKCGLR